MRENPYQGINAHFNSSLQAHGTKDQPSIWPPFHFQHIADIVAALNVQLPPHYAAYGEHSLQVRGLDEGGEKVSFKPKPDIGIFQQSEVRGGGMPVTELAPTWEASIYEVIEPKPQFFSAVIREVYPQGKMGRLVTRIELLSPSNKPKGSNYNDYIEKRFDALHSEIPLIEIDYLHEQAPILPQIPAYPKAKGAYPYSIIVTDPRPDWFVGTIQAYGFGVNEAIKKFLLPLAKDEHLIFDLSSVYQHTFQTGRWTGSFDYTKEPERFATYSAEDQAKIRAVMATIHNQTT